MVPRGTGSSGLFYTYVQAQNEIQATHLIEIASWHGLDPQYAYPFDTYVVDTSFLALNSDTNQSLPILDLSPADSTDNFTPYIIQQWSTRINTTGTEVDGRFLQMGFRRTILSQFFVVVLFAVNWGLTLVVLFITIAATDGQKVDVSILILPVTVILTIPALRALWVGAPAFGLLLDGGRVRMFHVPGHWDWSP
ncbi:hypothetical protein EW026_g6511 [Hermanssonia centrifuga]|uniref:Uncharacterized protein n=1 Tax=Hermanssonia centrifuga TaxID=98765 RepID=A0A4S4KF46_9APHY|nr:hypothetical protein EW026_g6511 [Hermanssonia centrifuga]